MTRSIRREFSRSNPSQFGRRVNERRTSGLPVSSGSSIRQPSITSQDDEGAANWLEDVGSSSVKLAWAYFKAVIVAFASALGLMAILVSGANNPMADFQIYKLFVGAIVAMSLAPVMAIPAYIVARIVSLIKIPRGAADIVVGGVLGSAWLLMQFSEGKLPSATAFCFFLGGLVGGFSFWRSCGYPGVSRRMHHALDDGFVRVRRNV